MSNLILPSTDLIKPATLSRRGFLRALGVTTAVVIVTELKVAKATFPTGSYRSGDPNAVYFGAPMHFFSNQNLAVRYYGSHILERSNGEVLLEVMKSEFINGRIETSHYGYEWLKTCKI